MADSGAVPAMRQRLSNLLKRWFVEYGVPANRRFGIKIDAVRDDDRTFVLKLPYRRRNLNVGRTVHGSAIMALAETVHGVAVLWQFAPRNHFMFTKATEMQFMAPGKGDLYVRFSLEEDEIQRLDNILEKQRKTEVTFQSLVTDESDQAVASLRNTYHLSRRSATTPVSPSPSPH